MFHSMLTITIAAVIFFLLLLGIATRRSPFTIVFNVVQQLVKQRYILYYLLATLGILLLNKWELHIEQHTPLTNNDFTSSFYLLEGAITGWLQHTFQSGGLTYFFTFVYVVLFPAMMVAGLFIYIYHRQDYLVKAFFITIMLNYAIAIPFYLWFPVNEVWVMHPDVQFLIPDAYPLFETEYRPMSGLDNCFPSLHTSLSISIALLAIASGHRLWKWISSIIAILVVISTNYLGIHWLIDIAGGFILAGIAAMTALRVVHAPQSQPQGVLIPERHR